MKIEIEFTESLLGTLSGNPAVAKEFILSKHPSGIPQEDELASLPPEEAVEKTSTIHRRNTEGKVVIYDYQWKGFLKEACEAMIGTGTMTQKELSDVRLTRYLYKKTIDQLVFVNPRMTIVEGTITGFLERPLRGQTMRGERISLARSEQVAAGAKCKIDITWMNKNLEPFIEQWLNYGILKGMLQWRSGGYGRFLWKKV